MTSKFSIFNFQFSKGFTLIEVIAVSGIMALFSITLISILMASFRGGTKSQLIQRIRQEGDNILTSMSREIKRAAIIYPCESDSDSLTFTLVDDDYSIKYWQGGSGKIASASGDGITDLTYLAGGVGMVGTTDDLSFKCYTGATGSQIVTISFTLTAGEEAGSQAQEKLSQEFATSVSTRQH